MTSAPRVRGLGLCGLAGAAAAWLVTRRNAGQREAERQRSQKRLERSEAERRRSEQALRSLQHGVAVLDAGGRCTSINPQGARLLGYEPSDLVGRVLHDLVHNRHPDGSLCPTGECRLLRAVSQDQIVRFTDEAFWRHDGSRLPVHCSAAPLFEQGRHAGAVVSFIDAWDRWDLSPEEEILGAELRRAIANRQLVVHYQPKLALPDESVIGAEALVRWDHPGRGLIYPDQFVPLAERCGLMRVLTEFVIGEAVAQQQVWRGRGLDCPVAVNISPSSLADPAFPDDLSAICTRHHAAPEGLELELTESSFMGSPDQAVAMLWSLAGRGFSVTIDDFGTGFSSLAYLRDLPAACVKIDKSFLIDLESDGPNPRILQGTIDLVHGLGKKAVAEGVESSMARDLLVRLGCDAGQGYLWSRPVPSEELVAMASAGPVD